MLSSTLFACVMLAIGVSALPNSAERYAARAAARHKSSPKQTIENSAHRGHPGGSSGSGSSSSGSGSSSGSSVSQNWAGAALSSAEGTYKSVTGTFTVPKPKLSSEGGGEGQAASVWVGIDGDSCQSALLQTGVDLNVDGDGNVSYDAWYEWIPAGAIDFTGISFKAGDVVTLTVTAKSTTSGTAVIENTTSGKKVTKDLTSRSKLCMQDAEWIVEDFEQDGELVPFANFGTVTFTDASATTGSGAVGPANAGIIELGDEDGNILTSTSVDDSSVTVSYKPAK